MPGVRAVLGITPIAGQHRASGQSRHILEAGLSPAEPGACKPCQPRAWPLKKQPGCAPPPGKARVEFRERGHRLPVCVSMSLLQPNRARPYVLDDATVARIIRVTATRPRT